MIKLATINPAPTSSRDQILRLLKIKGEQTVGALAAELEVTTVAIRQHLAAMETDGLVAHSANQKANRAGRPAHLWTLTAKANEQFPDAHDQLAVELLQIVHRSLGESVLERIIGERTEKKIQEYRARMPKGRLSLAQRVAAVVHLRRQDGFIPEWRRSQDGTLELIENHCAIGRAAELCPRLCGAEHELFQRLLGDDVEVHRFEHLGSGDRRCAYRIHPAKKGAGSREATLAD